MKKKWKIILGVIVSIVVLFFIIVFLSYFLMQPGKAPSIVNPYPKPIPSNSVDRLLDKMEFGVIAFNAPPNININDSPQIQLLLSLAETVENLKQVHQV